MTPQRFGAGLRDIQQEVKKQDPEKAQLKSEMANSKLFASFCLRI
jgi:hypothetical protein